MKTMHLFAGAGGGLLADLILGHEPVVAVEWDAYCCQVLRERAEEGWFPGLQVWEGDVRLFDPSDWAGRVDCIHAGFPCQDISHAGRQAGVGEGTRSGLYREVLRIADVVRPRFLFLENVAAILGNGLDVVLGDLAALGYDGRWTCLRASDCGAHHLRDRWWYVAYSGCEGLDIGDSDRGIHSSEKRKDGRQAIELGGQAWRREEVPADSIICGQPRSWSPWDASNTASGGEGQAVEPWDGCRSDFWSIEPDVGRVAHGVASRVDRLKALGNGQVPLQAALAWRILTEGLT